LKFTRLRLSGFKSFIEPTELFIEPGLTAIVGPNGCGKSNLFDALRWVMGETRPTSIRGTEMDDVIFAGSAGRPSRNMAEVALIIDNADRTAGGPYADFETIEVSRRIERDAGSVYRINGRDVRQRDVQIFFADASSGAGSTAFVRQGQIGLLISQKPLARRAILEEAAGIGGLHQRRHEAEIRLKAAEANLARLDDVIREVEGQLQNLKRQARQASRYRNLSGHIRKAEALAHYLRWTAAELRLAAVQEELSTATSAVEHCTSRAAEASTRQATVAAELPPLRQTEAERSAALHRLVLERDALDAEEARSREAAQRLRQRVAQVEQDQARERSLGADSEAALAKLSEELASLEAASGRATSDIADADQSAAALNAALSEAEGALERSTAALAEWNARKASLERGRDAALALADTNSRQLAEAKQRLDTALATAALATDVGTAEQNTEGARSLTGSAREAFAAAREALAKAEKEEEDARQPLERAEIEVQRLSAEAKALGEVLPTDGASPWPPLIDSLMVQPGYEAALAAALGDELHAPLEEAAPHHWSDLGKYDDAAVAAAARVLPERAVPLILFVKAPPALTRRLEMTGVVFPDQGAILQTKLKPGQRLVSPRGDLWRWDGYSASAEAPSRAAVPLAQGSRLVAIEREIDRAKKDRAAALARYTAARSVAESAREKERQTERDARAIEQALIAAQDDAAKSARAAAEHASRTAALEAEIRRLEETREAASAVARQANAELLELGDGTALKQAATEARNAATAARDQASEMRAHLDSMQRDREVRSERLAAIAEDRARWSTRREAATAQIEELERRVKELGLELKAVETLPSQITSKRSGLLDAIATAESMRNAAADARTGCETRLAEADRSAKECDRALSSAREERARSQALFESAEARITELRERIRDELDAAPDDLADRAELRDDQELPPLDQAEKRVEKLKQEREQLGGVNLRADEEANEHEQRLQTLTSDRNDLQGAIDRLRRGIQSLNREGRERLVQSFEKVNKNFHELFAKLFQGGEARLTFTESDDPLEAGLEIYARPPGKRLQSLGLLSGGEQALTALALIFAVFLVNPAPVCVLDEVDAPLDDANVERFCNLIEEMTRLADTRFLVITHHALTMSRMHRLFGVTMAERGVSQLVSVSLSDAERVAAE
jgi:chromosome segregation protein